MKSPSKNSLIALAAALGIATIWMVLGAINAPDPHRDESRENSPDLDRVISDVLTELEKIGTTEDAASEPEEGMAAKPQAAQQTASVECEWWDGVHESRRQLGSLLSFGPISPEALWRHPLLNIADRAPCRPDREALEVLLKQVLPQWQKMKDHLENVKLEEMASVARSGRVTAWQGQPATDDDLRRRAAILQKARRNAGIEEDLDSVVAGLRDRGWAPGPHGSYVRIDGTYYLQSSFGDALPRTRQCKEAMGMVSLHCATLIVGFFVTTGYTQWSASLDKALQNL